jgi:hypothetical protein
MIKERREQQMKQQMDLIIFHYHILPGGVTDVIRLSLQAFYQDSRFRSITIVCGRNENISTMEDQFSRLKEASPGPALSIKILPELDYLNEADESSEKGGDLKMLLMKQFSSANSIWLIHNYHLGKNWLFTRTVLELAGEGVQKMILQIHDFPECGRYTNLKRLKDHISGSLYCDSPSVRYCVINKRDYNLLLKAGLKESRLFLLENPVVEEKEAPGSTEDDRRNLIAKLSAYSPAKGNFHNDGQIWLYPVRSIRRKNILEGGLIVGMMEKPVNLVVTLPGISSQEKGYSDMAEQAFKEGIIPGFWGSGLLPEESGIGYRDMIRNADLIYSSSIQEGFGYMYLNAILWNKPLIARYLDIMEGFMPLFESYPSRFYSSVRIPARKRLKETVRNEYLDRFDTIRPSLPAELKEKLREELEGFLKEEGIDFSYISALDQYSALQTLTEDKGYLKECREMNASLMSSLKNLTLPGEGNHREKLYENYGLPSYRKAFSRILDSLQNSMKKEESSDSGKLEKSLPDAKLLQDFTRLEYLRLLYK